VGVVDLAVLACVSRTWNKISHQLFEKKVQPAEKILVYTCMRTAADSGRSTNTWKMDLVIEVPASAQLAELVKDRGNGTRQDWIWIKTKINDLFI